MPWSELARYGGRGGSYHIHQYRKLSWFPHVSTASPYKALLTPCTLASPCYTLYSIHSIQYTVGSIQYAVYMQYTVYILLYTAYCILYTVYCTVYTPCKVDTANYTLNNMHCPLHTAHYKCTLHSVHYKCTLHTAHYKCTLHSVHYGKYSSTL